jgi:hypothetical protein
MVQCHPPKCVTTCPFVLLIILNRQTTNAVQLTHLCSLCWKNVTNAPNSCAVTWVLAKQDQERATSCYLHCERTLQLLPERRRGQSSGFERFQPSDTHLETKSSAHSSRSECRTCRASYRPAAYANFDSALSKCSFENSKSTLESARCSCSARHCSSRSLR